jgi:hypothetical protein
VRLVHPDGFAGRVFCVPNGFMGARSNSIMRGQRQLFPKWNWKKQREGDAAPSSWGPPDSVNHPSLPAPRPFISNRNTAETGSAVTPRKQRTMVLSNRNKKPPPGGVASWLPHRPALYPFNRNTLETGSAVTPRKQRTVVLSNRNKKPPPGGVASWLPHRRHSASLPGTHTQTGFAVNPCGSAT